MQVVKSQGFHSMDLIPWYAETALDPKIDPILLTEEEMKAIDFEHVWTVISQPSKYPSDVAEIKQERLSPTLKKINTSHARAMKEYEALFHLALGEDLKNIKLRDKNLEEILDHHNYTWEYTTYGLWYLLIGAIPGFIYGVAMDRGKAELNELKIENLRREECAFRRNWLSQVDALERKRFEVMKNDIELRAETIMDSLDELQSHVLNKDLVKELRDLHSLHRVMFPKNSALLIKDVEVGTYLEKFTSIENQAVY